jgi:hypothetical protein
MTASDATNYDLPERLRDLAESLEGDDWEHPLLSQVTCRLAADEIERARAEALCFAAQVKCEHEHTRVARMQREEMSVQLADITREVNREVQ